MAEREYNFDEERAKRRPSRVFGDGPLGGRSAPSDGSSVVIWRDDSDLVPIIRTENVHPGGKVWSGERCKQVGQRLIGIYVLGSSGHYRWMPGKKDGVA